jgi:hypothetical protein
MACGQRQQQYGQKEHQPDNRECYRAAGALVQFVLDRGAEHRAADAGEHAAAKQTPVIGVA